MNIKTDIYFDRNFGDDMMLRLLADRFGIHDFFINERKKECLFPFAADMNIHDIEYTPHDVMNAYLKVTGSGFIIRNRRAMLSAAIDNMRDRDKKLPRFLMGASLDPLPSRLAENIILSQLKKFDSITVRDKYSYEYLKSRLKLREVYYRPDILFALPDKWIPKKTDEGCLGISAHRKLGGDNMLFCKKMSELSDIFIDRTGKKVILFAFDIGMENDLCIAYTIRAMCRNKDMVEIVAHDDGGDSIIKGYARCHKVVAVRFHSIVLAMRMGVPFIPIIYAPKSDNLLSDLGYCGIRIENDNINSIYLADAVLDETPKFYISDEILRQAGEHFEIFSLFLKSAVRRGH